MNTDPDAVNQLLRDLAAARSFLEGLPCTSTAPQPGRTGHPVMSHRLWFLVITDHPPHHSLREPRQTPQGLQHPGAWRPGTPLLRAPSLASPTCPETPALHGWGHPFWLR